MWLQRFGGARNPLVQSIDAIIKKEEDQSQKTGSDFTAARKEAKKEKLTAEGLRPGERLLLSLYPKVLICAFLLLL